MLLSLGPQLHIIKVFVPALLARGDEMNEYVGMQMQCCNCKEMGCIAFAGSTKFTWARTPCIYDGLDPWTKTLKAQVVCWCGPEPMLLPFPIIND